MHHTGGYQGSASALIVPVAEQRNIDISVKSDENSEVEPAESEGGQYPKTTELLPLTAA